jgi:hypothetical protein
MYLLILMVVFDLLNIVICFKKHLTFDSPSLLLGCSFPPSSKCRHDNESETKGRLLLPSRGFSGVVVEENGVKGRVAANW